MRRAALRGGSALVRRTLGSVVGGRRGGGAFLDRGHQGVDDVGVELRAGARLELGDGARRRQRLAIGPVAEHRPVGVAHRDEAAGERDPVRLDPVRVALAVPALVVEAHDGGHRLQAGDVRERVGSPLRMAPHDRPLVVGQRPRLAQDAVGHPDLAQIVEPGGGGEVEEVGVGDAQAAADLAGQVTDLPGVLGGVAVAQVEQCAQRLHARAQALLELPAHGGVLQSGGRQLGEVGEQAQLLLAEPALRVAGGHRDGAANLASPGDRHRGGRVDRVAHELRGKPARVGLVVLQDGRLAGEDHASGDALVDSDQPAQRLGAGAPRGRHAHRARVAVVAREDRGDLHVEDVAGLAQDALEDLLPVGGRARRRRGVPVGGAGGGRPGGRGLRRLARSPPAPSGAARGGAVRGGEGAATRGRHAAGVPWSLWANPFGWALWSFRGERLQQPERSARAERAQRREPKSVV